MQCLPGRSRSRREASDPFGVGLFERLLGQPLGFREVLSTELDEREKVKRDRAVLAHTQLDDVLVVLLGEGELTQVAAGATERNADLGSQPPRELGSGQCVFQLRSSRGEVTLVEVVVEGGQIEKPGRVRTFLGQAETPFEAHATQRQVLVEAGRDARARKKLISKLGLGGERAFLG